MKNPRAPSMNFAGADVRRLILLWPDEIRASSPRLLRFKGANRGSKVLQVLFLAGTSLLLTAGVLLSQENKPIAGFVTDVTIAKLHTGFTFTEGPAADAKGNLYFTDVRANRIHKV